LRSMLQTKKVDRIRIPLIEQVKILGIELKQFCQTSVHAYQYFFGMIIVGFGSVSVG